MSAVLATSCLAGKTKSMSPVSMRECVCVCVCVEMENYGLTFVIFVIIFIEFYIWNNC